MGHVDHGKTSLLDAIRQANVVSGEAGGITQHIGAYQVTAPNGTPITFIDTPGHAAFTAMRARGAKVTDIVVLVVAADDGVMPQTIEAINHASAAQVPMIVAINKIDKPDAKPERVRTELLQHEVQVETMGGETLEVEVSAKQQTNLDKLLEADRAAGRSARPQGQPRSRRRRHGHRGAARQGPRPGRDRAGAARHACASATSSSPARNGAACARCSTTRASRVHEAGPSFPVEILGFTGTPEAGDRVAVVESEARAREITEYRERQKRDKIAARGGSARGSLSDMMSQLKTAGRKEFPLVIKGDVQGSVEAIVAALEKLGTDEVGARIVHAGVGGISESDIALAEASNAAVIGFNVRAHKEAREAAERAGIEIRYYNIIYNLVDDVKAAMSGLLAPTLRETMLGNAQILEVFDISKVGKVAGCRVTDGNVERGANVRLIRDNVVVHEGKLSTLKRFKDEVKEVAGRTGMRHGLRELPGHARRRRHRVLPRRGDQANAVKAAPRDHRPGLSRPSSSREPRLPALTTLRAAQCRHSARAETTAIIGSKMSRAHHSQRARAVAAHVARRRTRPPRRSPSCSRAAKSAIRCSSSMSSPCRG